jgi:hypothetical protein
MPLITETPVALVSANQWVIADVKIDPALPSVSYQVVAKLNGAEVQRTTISAAGAELLSIEGMPQLYGTIKAMLYADAIARGIIPQGATEQS